MSAGDALVDGLQRLSVNGVSCCFVDTVEGVVNATKMLQLEKAVAVDLEGVNLGRLGRIATVQLCGGTGITYIFDIAKLDKTAFDAKSGLRALLEDASISKLFFDVRADANALFHLYNVVMPASSIVDLQLLDVCQATMAGNVLSSVRSLGHVLDSSQYGKSLSFVERSRMSTVKQNARKLFSPELGGSYDVWLTRPLAPLLMEYACDVRHFLELCTMLSTSIEPHHEALQAAVRKRLAHAHTFHFSTEDRDANTLVDDELVTAIASNCTAPVQMSINEQRATAVRLAALPLDEKIRSATMRKQGMREMVRLFKSGSSGTIDRQKLFSAASYIAEHDRWCDPQDWREFIAAAADYIQFTPKQRATLRSWLESGGVPRRNDDDEWYGDDDGYEYYGD